MRDGDCGCGCDDENDDENSDAALDAWWRSREREQFRGAEYRVAVVSCLGCGSQLDPRASFCPICGTCVGCG